MTARKVRRCAECGDTTMRAARLCAACGWAFGSSAIAGHGRVPVTCWCEATSLWVDRRLVSAGVTRSCGLEDCGPELLEVTA